MAFLDFIRNRNAAQQQPVAATQQPAAPSVQGLSELVKAQAVEAGRPAAQLLQKATTPRTTPPPAPTPNDRGRGRSLGMGL